MSITPIFVSNIILIFPCVGLIIIFNALDPYMQLKSGYYDETVEAVCVEVESKIRRSSSVSSNSSTTTVVYRPFYMLDVIMVRNIFCLMSRLIIFIFHM